MHVPRGARRLEQRPHRAGGDRDVGRTGGVEDAQGVVDDLVERGVAGHAGDAEHVESGMPTAKRMARASSTPVSTSRMTGMLIGSP